MKKLFTLLLVISIGIVAHAGGKYGYCKLVFVDGSSRTGLVETSLDKDVRFKSSDENAPEKIPSEKIKTVAFLKEDGKTSAVEYDYIKVYLGWGQKRISDYAWFEVLQRGTATLYLRRTEMRGSIYNTTTAGFLDYYVMRDGEPAAKMISNVSSFNNNQTFHAKAPLYFADYPELAEKIKSKEYTWKELGTVVRLYNEWAAANKK
ncbi:MAG: hypothetical protein JST42_13840 [Bacteroidetes bacterium]|nr:hypothetical protein [Bacteroidota bacterium]